MTDSVTEIIAGARREDRVYLLEHECKTILRDIGVPTTSCLVAKSEEEADAIIKKVWEEFEKARCDGKVITAFVRKYAPHYGGLTFTTSYDIIYEGREKARS